MANANYLSLSVLKRIQNERCRDVASTSPPRPCAIIHYPPKHATEKVTHQQSKIENV
jgi:hypothetical protein